MLEKVFLKSWHEASSVSLDKRETDLSGPYVRLWNSFERELGPAANAQNMKITIKGLRGKEKYQLAHDLGFGCEWCETNDEKANTTDCGWEARLGF